MTDEQATEGVRDSIAQALDGFLTPEQLHELIDEILKIKKGARGWCPNCKKQVGVEIPDAKSVAGAITDLANQAFGRPRGEQGEQGERIVFERVVYMGADE